MAPTVTAGRTSIIVGNLAYSIGAFIADYSETHVFNERWPPHVRASDIAPQTQLTWIRPASTTDRL